MKATGQLRLRTFLNYQNCFRTISEAFGVKGDESKFDYRQGGNLFYPPLTPLSRRARLSEHVGGLETGGIWPISPCIVAGLAGAKLALSTETGQNWPHQAANALFPVTYAQLRCASPSRPFTRA